MAPIADPSNRRFSWPAVPWPVLVVAGLMVAGLVALSGAYGFHGDEMYYIVAGRHPAFGYVDQPPLTPLLSAASVAIFGVSPTAVRLLPAIEMGLVVIVIALLARDLGGSRRAQVLAAITAAISGYLGAGHLDTTTEPDLLAWAIVLWLLVKLLAGGDQRLWLAVGIVAGIALENKDTILFLGAGLAVGLVLARRWDIVRSPWAWAAVGIALLIWAPNLAWLLWIFTGPFLFPVSAAGLIWVLRTKAAAPWRAIGIAALVALALVVISGGKAYYVIGTAPLFIAAGAMSLDRWLARGHFRLKAGSFTTAAVLSGALIAYLTLPILPVAEFAKSSLPATVPDTANQVGWPQFVATVENVVATLPADQRAHAVILTNDYSEASPLILMGTGLPPADLTVVIHVGDWRPTDWGQFFVGCHVVATIDNGLGIDNGEQGTAVSVCTGLRAPWTTLWPSLRTIS
jgi:hypothetical protein